MGQQFTLILAGPDQQSADVLAELTQWSGAGLVKDFVWLDVARSGPAAPGVDPVATLVSAGTHRPVGLLQAIGAQRRTEVRAVVLQPLSGPRDVDPAMLNLSWQVLDLIREVLPSATFEDSDQAITELRDVLLSIPTTASKDVAFNQAIPAWAHAVVVAPEIRKAPDTVPRYVTQENLACHAALHAAAVGCLLKGQSEGVFDSHLKAAGSGEPGTVVMLRVFARNSISSDLADSLTAVVAEMAAGRQALPISASTGSSPSLRDHYLVQVCFEDLVSYDNAALSSQLPAADGMPPKRQTGAQAFADVARFALEALLMLPQVLWNLIVAGAEHSATAVTYGRAGTTEVRFRAATSAELESGAYELVSDDIQHNIARIAEAKNRRTAVPTPALWNRLREVSFGLLDGKLPPDSPLCREDGPVEVLRSRASLVLPVADRLALSGTVAAVVGSAAASELTPADPTAAGETVQLMSRVRDYVEASVREEEEGAGGSDSGSSAEPSQAAQLREDLPQPLQDSLDEASLEDLREPLDADLERARDYQQRLGASLHGQLLAHTGAALHAARSTVERLEVEATTANSLKARGVRRMRAVYLWLSYFAIGSWLAMLTWSLWTVPERHSMDWVIRYPLLYGGLALIAVIAVLIVVYFQVHSAFQRKVTLLRHHLALTGRQCAAAIADLSRLEDVDIQLREWSQIISRTVHEPFGTAPAPPRFAEMIDEHAPALPATFAVEVEPSRLPSIVEQVAAAESVIKPGWLAETFSGLVALVGEPLQLTGPQYLDEADEDVPSTPNGLRGHLLQALQSGAIQSRATEGLRDRIGMLLGALADAQGATGPPGAASGPLQGPPTAFALFDFSPIGQARRAFQPKTVHWWGPGGRPDPSIEATHLPRVVEAGRTMELEVRADFTRHLQARAFAFYGQEHPDADTFIADPDSPY